MRYIIRKSLQRKYDLLVLLLNATTPIPKQEVAQMIKCSRPTLDTTITNANELIKEYGEIEFTKQGLVLKQYKELNHRQIRGMIIYKTFLVQILNDILFGKIESIEQWSYDNYLSPSTSYKYMNQTVNYLAQFNIELLNENGQWVIKGDEWQIRYMYFQMLKEASVFDQGWPFEGISIEAIYDYARKMFKELELYMGPLVEYQYVLMTGIHLQLIKNKKDRKYTQQEKVDYLKEFHRFEEPISILEKEMGTIFSDEDKGFLISTMELFPVHYLNNECKVRRINYAKQTSKDVYQLAELAYQVFAEQESDFDHHFIKYLDIFGPLEPIPYYMDFSSDIIENQDLPNFKERIDEDFTQKLRQYKQVLKEEGLYDYYERNSLYIAKQLYFVSRLNEESKKFHPVKATVMSQFGQMQEDYYIEKIKSYFSKRKIVILNTQEVHTKNEWENVDLIVTDFTFSNHQDHYNVFYIDDDVDETILKKMDKYISTTQNE